MKIHENSYHNHFPIASRRKYLKILIIITSQLLLDENAWKFSSKPHPNCLLKQKYTKNLIPIAPRWKYSFQSPSRWNTWKSCSNCLPDEIHKKSHSNHLPDVNTRKISLQLLPDAKNLIPITFQMKTHENTRSNHLSDENTRKISFQLPPRRKYSFQSPFR